MRRLLRNQKENLIYLALWVVIFAAPVISSYVRASSDSGMTVSWQEILYVWRTYAVFLLIFIVHNYVLAPLLVYRHRRLMYFATTACLLAVFVVYNCVSKPHLPKPYGPPPYAAMQDNQRPPLPADSMDGMDAADDIVAAPDARQPMPMGPKPRLDGVKPGIRPDGRPGGRPPLGPPIMHEGDVVNVLFLILLLGVNLAVKLFFKSDADQQHLQSLERKSLEQQLAYLRYQINPHFFMNTLNNIHALIDIEPELAKTTIVDLSRLMRYVLYEGDNNNVPLSRDLEFLDNYIKLMKLRYSDRVAIHVDKPQQTPDVLIPPMLFITFVENAFKHGITYQQPSFIDISIQTNQQELSFSCCNSKPTEPAAALQQEGGVGLANVRQRLDLIFGNTYSLEIDDLSDTYNVRLVIPIS